MQRAASGAQSELCGVALRLLPCGLPGPLRNFLLGAHGLGAVNREAACHRCSGPESAAALSHPLAHRICLLDGGLVGNLTLFIYPGTDNHALFLGSVHAVGVSAEAGNRSFGGRLVAVGAGDDVREPLKIPEDIE